MRIFWLVLPPLIIHMSNFSFPKGLGPDQRWANMTGQHKMAMETKYSLVIATQLINFSMGLMCKGK
jgi:hypothetical protein